MALKEAAGVGTPKSKRVADGRVLPTDSCTRSTSEGHSKQASRRGRPNAGDAPRYKEYH